jgi:adenine-specific DNA-methyltransferase
MPPRKKTAAKSPTTIDSITHADKRANLPTVDTQDFLAPELEQPVPVRYPRDPTLDPQLVWKGKDELDGEDLVADAPPIYIQEKIDPRVLVENLRKTAVRPDEEPELTLFDDFDGLSELDLVEFYEHDANWSNRMILGDSLNVMASLSEREALRGKVQMIYVDPPYGIKFGSNWQVSARKRNVTDGKMEDATREVEQIKAFRDTWELGIHSYLTYLRDRLAVAKDLLTESGSIFVQIGDENVHLVRSLMDEVFGSENFRSLITYRTSVGLAAEGLDSVSNYLLWYSKSERYKFRNLYTETRPGERGASRYKSVILADGSTRRAHQEELEDPSQLPAGAHLYRDQGLTSRTGSRTTVFPVEFRGRTYQPTSGGWRTSEPGMQRLRWADRLLPTGNTLSFRKHWDDFSALSLTNFWDDVSGGITSRGDPKIYVVQTATKIVERCLLMTTDPGDLVLDPTCGSGTTSYVAEQWGRRWMTMDTSRVALALARQRLLGARFPYYLLADSPEGRAKESEASGGRPPTKTTTGICNDFVYERLQHITLKSIANNPDIREGMTREEIDAAIRRHAEYEILHDRPYEDKRKVRVAGPFTVESLSPHRSLAFAGSAVDQTGSLNDDTVADASIGDASFEQTILANLRSAGIQNGRKEERLQLDMIESYAAEFIQAVGERDTTEDDGGPKRVGITIGPQYGTVGPAFVKDAAREANRAGDLDLLCVLAFAFDPSVLGSVDGDYVISDESFANVAAERRLGRVPVLLVRMNADLVMGDALKKTGAGNLFTVFGEPDIEIEQDGEELRVILHGVDVYDSNTGEIRSNDTDQIALWMVDTAYNGESFFVRHCYFTGGQDPYKRLKGALRADIYEDTWATLYRTESRPFPRPELGKIAVKVINDYGDEVLKVFDV